MIPSCDHTGTFHFHSSTTSGSAFLIKARSRLSISPRQSPSSSILASISCEGDLPVCGPLFFMPIFLLLDPEGQVDLFEKSRRTTWPFHIQSPVRTSMGRKTTRTAGAYCGMSLNGL